MEAANFIDHVKLYARAGSGGAGAVHFRRARRVPKGGPDGGDGGRGGHIYLVGKPQLATLLPLKYRKHLVAPAGQPGSKQLCSGADGQDLFIDVPLGTVVKDAQTLTVQAEITRPGQQYRLMRGGQGGKGNAHFKSAVRQAPRFAQGGTAGQEGWVVLELRLLADVGLIGPPNAGKSTLLAALSAARPQVAPYPFTTLTPQLGVVTCYPGQTLVMADIPGLIEGAAQGRGLGIRFLRHAARTRVLVFVVPVDDPDPYGTYQMLRKELGLRPCVAGSTNLMGP